MKPVALRQPLNPLDTLLLSTDEARRPLNLVGGDIFAFGELEGHLDLVGLRQALRALRNRYPTLTSRLHRGGWLRGPYWDLADPHRDREPVRLVELPPDDTAEAYLERALNERVDWSLEPPLRCTLLRGRDDTLLLRWPHFLMDGLSGAHIIDQLAELYDAQAAPVEVASAGDEARRDFGTLRADRPDWPWKRGSAPVPQPTGRTLRLADAGPLPARPGVPRLLIRRMTAEQAGRVRQAALGCCGIGRFADFLRATGVVVLDELVRLRGATEGGCYTSFHLLDNRRRRDCGPLCHNVFSTLPLFIPAEMAGDRRAVSELIHAQTKTALTTDLLQRRLDQLSWLTRLPVPLLARQVRRNWQRGPRGPGLGPGNPPSLPLGFLGPLPRERRTLCGAPFANLFGLIAPAPTAGFSVNVNAAQGVMNVAVVHDPQRLSAADAESFADRYVERLTRG